MKRALDAVGLLRLIPSPLDQTNRHPTTTNNNVAGGILTAQALGLAHVSIRPRRPKVLGIGHVSLPA